MFRKILFVTCFLFTSTHVFSQNINYEEHENNMPFSIYLENQNYSFLNTLFIEDLKLDNFKFLIVDEENLISNIYTIDFRNIGRKGSQFSYESYKKADLYKHFPVVPDIITLHRFNSNRSIKVN